MGVHCAGEGLTGVVMDLHTATSVPHWQGAYYRLMFDGVSGGSACHPWERGHPARRRRRVRAGYNIVRMARQADGIRGGRVAKRGASSVQR